MKYILPLGLALSFVMALPACRRGEDAAPSVTRGQPESQPSTQSSTRPTPQPNAPDGTGTQGVPDTSEVSLKATATADGSPGHVTDRAGSAVYFLRGNEDGTKCDTACEEAWPPVLATQARPVAGEGIQAEKLGMLARTNGALHVTYAGHPVYRYAADRGAGRTAGHGVEDQWGSWSLLQADGKPVAARQ
ncbi:secreted repeat protein with Y-X4-D motif [Luteimonas cucumeris]|uniref:Secreted repeat protein with Y-X4-D motif n=1 Tax=Luteimonas cucumeris TaxID=985012 RepID=A0A562L284_9GAMM|nr:hypothetical protein [Luteimonas cucumeris]TWI01742.1 secreted repeat protein with Y-X4-D motif [Luteimonas cucumeris]